MNVKGFAESTIKALGVTSFYDFMQLTYEKVAIQIGPTNASNLVEAIEQIKYGNLPDYMIIGSLGFSGCAANTWKLIFQTIPLRDFVQYIEQNPSSIQVTLANIRGIGPKTAEIIVNEYPYFKRDIQYILENVNYADSANLMVGYRKQIRFSGVRDLQLAEQLCNLGFDADGNSGITRNTEILIVPYIGYTSTKVSKVSPECKIVPIDRVRQAVANVLALEDKEQAMKLVETNIL
jgi:hypothetical protein